jgi:6-phosphogluconolactonase
MKPTCGKKSASPDPLSEILVYPDAETLAQAAAEQIVDACVEALGRGGRASLALCGGSTPPPIYSLLSQQPYSSLLDWQRLHIFWGDERLVPPDHPDSNYCLARERLLSRVPVPAENIHRMRGELEPHQAAADYELELRRFFGMHNDQPPVFDLVLLGMGEDGHVASLFLGSPALDVQDRWVVAVEHSAPPPPLLPRLSLTLPVINASRWVIAIVSGDGKAEILGRVLGKPDPAELLPAQLVRPEDGRLLWLVDRAAASRLAG